MTTNSGAKIHTNRLRPARHDEVAIGLAVEDRFLTLCESHKRIRGIDLAIPPELKPAAYLWRTAVARHRMGDFRITDDEKKATRAFADWTLRVNCELRNQTYKPVEWGA